MWIFLCISLPINIFIYEIRRQVNYGRIDKGYCLRSGLSFYAAKLITRQYPLHKTKETKNTFQQTG